MQKMRKLVKGLFIIGIIGMITIVTIKNNSVQMINLTLENIEALAEEEDGSGGENCYGEGSVDCSRGKYEWSSVGQRRRLWFD